MLDDFLLANRDVIIAQARERVAVRKSPAPTQNELVSGIPVFLDQLGDALRRARERDDSEHLELGESAGRHGGDLFRMGLTVGQVVHDYGDVCQVVTELAVQQAIPITGAEFKLLNLCLDDAIAGAVTEYGRQSERQSLDESTERLGLLAHELRNLLNAATLAFESIKRGHVAVGGSTGGVLDRSLIGMREMIDRSLAEVRLDAGIAHVVRIAVAELLEEVEIGATLQAAARGVHFAVAPAERAVIIEGDRLSLVAALSNLLQNAFKFTRPGGNVSLRTRVTAERVAFDVEDECGGLPPGKAEELFRPFEQRGRDRTGVGLGLVICRRAAQANGGEIHVRDVPGKGCVFTLELPRKAPPPLSAVSGGGGKQGGPASSAAPNVSEGEKPRGLRRRPARRAGGQRGLR